MEIEDGSVRKHVHPRDIVISTDPEDIAVVVTYLVEMTHLDPHDGTSVSDRKREKKKVKLRKHLKTSTNVSKLAAEIMARCPYIHESKREDLERAMQELQHVLIRDEIRLTTQQEGDWWRGSEDKLPQETDCEPSLANLEDYIGSLYEGRDKDDMGQKTAGTAKILALCHHVSNLEQLVQDQTLMGALTRVLHEEYQKSVELCYNIMRSFLAFSNFVEMHPILASFRVGNITLKIVELEIKRTQHRQEERRQKTSEGSSGDRAGSIWQAREVLSQKDMMQTRQQDKLLFVCLHVLINLAEDAATERKMVKRDLIAHLGELLDRTSANLLYLVLTFLKKLSIYDENKQRVKKGNFVHKIVQIVPCSCEPLLVMALRLLFNFSFDAELRSQLLKSGLVPRLVDLLKKPQHRARCLRLLYNLSMDDRCKALIAHTEAVPVIMQLILNFPQKMLADELAALAANLSLNQRSAECMASQRGLPQLLDRAMKTLDVNVMKIVRNISQWTYSMQVQLSSVDREYKQRGLWAGLVEPLLDTAVETDNHDLLLEILGTLCNLTAHDLPKGVSWCDVVTNYSLPAFICKLLVPGMTQSDVMLEVIMLVGVLAHDTAAATLLASSNVIRSLQNVLRNSTSDGKEYGDPEIQLQMMYTLWRLLMVKESREQVMYGTCAVADMLEALESEHTAVCKMADCCLDLVLEFDRLDNGQAGELGEQVKRQRFRVHNHAWITQAQAE